jgi:hypothetical protein
MTNSLKKNPTYSNPPKGKWKQDYNSAFRTKTKQSLSQLKAGKISIEELEEEFEELELPEKIIEVSDIYNSPKEDKHYWNFKSQHSFSDEDDEESYEEDLEIYEKSFRK